MTSTSHRLRRLAGDERGASALEFALVMPMMFAVFFGLVETGNAVMACRRVGHSAASLSDLVAQQSTTSTSALTDVFAAGGQMMAPLDTTSLKMKLTSVTRGSDGKITVDWSRGSGLTADSKGAVYPMPANMLTNTGDSAIIGTAQYTLVQATKYVLTNDLNYSSVSYAKPRNGSQVTCSNC